jgi:hypothetical protein
VHSNAVFVALVLAALAERGCVLPGEGPPPNEPLQEPTQEPSLEPDTAGASEGPAVETTTTAVRARKRHEERCESAMDVHLFVAPSAPSVNSPLRVLAVTDRPLTAELVLSSGGEAEARSDVRHGGPPYFWVAEVPSPRAETYTAHLVQHACANGGDTSLRVAVASAQAAPAGVEAAAVWPTRAGWSRALENVYSAWIETLFDAPDGAMPSWSALHEALRDPKRNLLFDYLGAGEDSVDAPVLQPDCADLPYFLRAYFAFKLGLPFGVSECDRGGPGRPPRCKPGLTTNEEMPKGHPVKGSSAQRFGAFLRTVANLVHSGSARVPLDDEISDYYPVPLSAESLRPGTIYADPYGHVLVIAKRLPQTAARGGVLLAVDAQPDGTVRRKRFWRGNFLYATERELGGVGWKRFRPVSWEQGKLVRASDAAIKANPDYDDISQDGSTLDAEAFFDAMDDVLAPMPVDPRRALLEIVAAIEEQIQTRVDSVDDGRAWLEKGATPVPMPGLATLFEATGTWEDLSTPSRDLRLLVAADFLAGMPTHVARRSSRYAVPAGQSGTEISAELDALLARELSARTIRYTRTDGSAFTLSLSDVLARKEELEMGYNPNDCPEVRWGAPAGSDEAKTCRSRAPAEQQRRMQAMRVWFHERRRPPRR